MAMVFVSGLLAQPPFGFNYQAVLRDASGELLASEDVTLDVAILQGSAEGTEVFSEMHQVQTNEFGLVNLQIGTVNSLEEIDWSADTYFLAVSIDGDLVGVSQLLSVPFALSAQTSADTFSGDYEDLENLPDLAGFVSAEDPETGDMLFYDGEGWQSVPKGGEGQVLTVAGGAPQWADPGDDDDGTVTDIDGNVYETVTIGDQEWMTENLRVTRYNNGDDIPTGLSDDDWGSTTAGAYAIYPHDGGEFGDDVEGINSSEEMVDAYGKLYNWYAVNDDRSLCPDGWHVPSDDDWSNFTDHLINTYDDVDSENVGNVLKDCRQVNSPLGGDCDTDDHPRWDEDDWTGEEHHGTNDMGFSALPAGSRHNSGFHYGIAQGAYFWTSSENTPQEAWYRGIFYNYGGVSRDGELIKADGFNVRCVRNTD